jgi:hypothetical protein
MTSTPWILEPDSVRLQRDAFQAVVDLRHPELGLHALRYDGVAVPVSRMMAFIRPGLGEGEVAPLADRFVRGDELVASYAESAPWPVQVDAVLRAAAVDRRAALLASVESIVSVRTQQLNSRSELTLETRFQAEEVLHLADASTARWASISEAGSTSLTQPDQPRCVLVRLDGGQMSYVEMLVPADSSADEVVAGREAAIRHRVFAHTLEKGVIVRIRIKGVLVVRQGDAQVAVAVYRHFTGEEPPLGS